jgi:hypothetical protein
MGSSLTFQYLDISCALDECQSRYPIAEGNVGKNKVCLLKAEVAYQCDFDQEIESLRGNNPAYFE